MKNKIKEKLADNLLNITSNINIKFSNDVSRIEKDNTNLIIESSTDNFKNNKFSNINYNNFNNSTTSYIKEIDFVNKINDHNVNDHENEFESRIEEFLVNLLEISVILFNYFIY